jgi:hypothetical protein
MRMQLVAQQRLDGHDPRWKAIAGAAFASKHLDHAALYLTRQADITQDHASIPSGDRDTLMHSTAQYRALPAKVAQWVLKHVTLAWKSSVAAGQEWAVDPGTFCGHPKLPK